MTLSYGMIVTLVLSECAKRVVAAAPALSLKVRAPVAVVTEAILKISVVSEPIFQIKA